MNVLLRCCMISAAASALLLTPGCATQDSRDAPWDPKREQTLFDQMPNWHNAAAQICCGHLRSCEPHQSPRC